MHTDDLALLHIPRTGGTSIQHYMMSHIAGLRVPPGVGYDEAPNAELVEGLPKGHVRLADFEECWGRDPASFDLIVAAIRDPYDQQLSQFVYWRHLALSGNNMVQHRWALEADSFTEWLTGAAADYHCTYEYHNVRPPEKIEPTPSYQEYGGFYRYWMTLDGEIPDNLEIIEIGELSQKLPTLLDPWTVGHYEVPHTNSPGPPKVPERQYTPMAAELVTQKFRWCFDRGWYEPKTYEDIVQRVAA